MAWTTITYTCGHEDKIQMYGPEKDRARKKAWMEEYECPECRAKHATERDEAKGYAALQGSPKQVAWASDIREEMFGALSRYARNQWTVIHNCLAQGRVTEEQAQEAIEADDAGIIAVIEGLRAETSAKWLIDNRGNGNAAVAAMAERYVA